MHHMPTDRGLVVVRDESDGTKSVFVCARVVDGTPRHTYATHVRARQVVIEPTVRMHRNAHSTFTTEIVDVVGTEDGVVYVSFPDYA